MKDYFEEYAPINGIRQYFLHYPAQSDIVLLFLHGGPGQSEAHLAYLTRPQSPVCSVVYYDQRGTGKTQSMNRSKPQDINLNLLLDDLKATIGYLKDKYKTKKILLLGHSWGSILGTEYAKRYPETVSAYIGMGQVVNFFAGERAGYYKLKGLVEASGHAKDITRLKKFSEYPNSAAKDSLIKSIMKFRRIQTKYGLSASNVIPLILKSPVFSLRDIPPFLSCLKTNVNLFKTLFDYATDSFWDYPLPVFYILGRDDWQVPSVVAEAYFNKINAPKKKLYWIEDAGHLTDVDNPVEYNSAIERICAEL